MTDTRFNDIVFGTTLSEVKKVRFATLGRAWNAMGLLTYDSTDALSFSLCEFYPKDYPRYSLLEMRAQWYLFRFIIYHAFVDDRGVRLVDMTALTDSMWDSANMKDEAPYLARR